MTHEKLSVLMAVYNAEKYLSYAIESILNQSFTNFKFIIIDDCSKDRSPEIIDHYRKADRRILVHRNEENQGLAKSLNTGLGFCDTDYVARMDADDISEPTRLEKQYNFLQKAKNIDVCGTWIKIINEREADIGKWHTPLKHRNIINKNYISPALAHPTVMWKKSNLFTRGLYNEGFNHSEDYELWVRISNDVKFANIGEFLLRYRITDSGMTFDENRADEKRKSILRIQDNISNIINLDLSDVEREYFYAINLNERLKEISIGNIGLLIFLIKFFIKVTLHTKVISLNFLVVVIHKYLITFYNKD